MLSIGIAHSAWSPARRDALKRLLHDLHPPGACHPPVHVSASPKREHASEWALRLWEWAALCPPGPIVLLNDDVEVCPDFTRAVLKAFQCAPEGDILSFHTQAPMALAYARQGHRYLRGFWVTGPAYGFRSADVAKDILRFVAYQVPPGRFASTNEDNLLHDYMWARRKPGLHTIPALVKHDVTLASTYTGDAGSRGEPVHKTHWDAAPELCLTDWTSPDTPPSVECPWAPIEELRRIERSYLVGTRPDYCWVCKTAPAEVKGTDHPIELCSECAVGFGSQGIQAFLRRAAMAGVQLSTRPKPEEVNGLRLDESAESTAQLPASGKASP